MAAWVFDLHACICCIYVQDWQKPAEGILFPETGFTDSCELPCRPWKLNPCLTKD